MEKEFLPYELAVKLKALGFDEPCFGIWKDGKLISVGGHWGAGITHSMFGFEGDRFAPDEYRASTFSQAFRWFREKFDLRIWIESNHGVLKFEYVIATTNHNFIDKQFNDFSSDKTYEEAELACLDKLIEIVENKLK
jgi:hypothetical protein